MAVFMKNVKSKYNMKTYEGTKTAYDWIVYVINQIEPGGEKIHASFLFDVGKIGCNCDSIEEFTEHAYGQDRYELITMQIMKKQKSGQYIYITCSDSDDVYISTNDKVTLEKIVKLLEETDIESENKNMPNVNIQNNYNIGSIKGNNNSIVQGDNNNVTLSEEVEKKSKLKELVVIIFEKILRLLKK